MNKGFRDASKLFAYVTKMDISWYVIGFFNSQISQFGSTTCPHFYLFIQNKMSLFFFVFSSPLSLCSQVMSVHLNHWRLDRRLGLGLLFLYAIFLLCSILFGQMWGFKVKGRSYQTTCWVPTFLPRVLFPEAMSCSSWEFLCSSVGFARVILYKYNYTNTHWSLL